MEMFKILPILSLISLLIFCIFGFTNAAPAKDDEEHINIARDLVEILEKIPLEHFQGDSVVDQYVDALNEFTTYKVGGSGKRGANVYERNSNDLGREAVVLLPTEDQIVSKNKEKKVYIGLRRAGDDDHRYYVINIYLRDPEEKETGAVKIDGKEKIVEYDLWINRQDRELALERRFGWDECSTSIFVPCQTHQQPSAAKLRKATGSSKSHKADKGKKSLPAVKAEEGYDADENVDFFYGLEDDAQEARFVEMITGALGGVLAPVTGILGGLVGQAGSGGLLGGLLGGGGGGGGLLGGILGGGGGAPPGGPGAPGDPNAGAGGGGMLGGLLGGGGGGGGLLGGLLGGKRKKRSLGAPPTQAEINHARTIQLGILTSVSQKLDQLLAEGLMKTDLHSYQGWKTMDDFAGTKAGSGLSHEYCAFIGFGTCSYENITTEDYDKISTGEQALQALSKVLRMSCSKRKYDFSEALLTDGYIKFTKDKVFELQLDNKFVKREKLSPKRRSELNRAVEIAVFSKAFKEELYSKTPAIAPESSAISRRVAVLGETILEGIELIITSLKQHQIMLLRNLAMTVKTAFTKLLQDYEAFKDCKGCTEDLEINKADQAYLLTISNFIIHGLGPVHKNPASLRDVLKKFNETNSDIISQRLEAYL